MYEHVFIMKLVMYCVRLEKEKVCT